MLRQDAIEIWLAMKRHVGLAFVDGSQQQARSVMPGPEALVADSSEKRRQNIGCMFTRAAAQRTRI